MWAKPRDIAKFVWSNAKIFGWSLVAVGAMALAGWIYLLKRRPNSTEYEPKNDPDLIQVEIRKKIELLEEEAQIQAEKIKAKSEEDRRRIEEIEKIEDGAERRKALASWLDKNL